MIIIHYPLSIIHCAEGALPAVAQVAEKLARNRGIGVLPIVEGMRLRKRLVVEEHQVAVQFLRNHQVVRDDDDGSLEQRSHVVDQRQQVAAVVVVETGGGFVHQEQLGVHRPGTCDGDALLHAHAQLVREHCRTVPHAHQVHGHVDLFFDLLGGTFLVVTQGERDVVADAQVRNQGPVLENEPHLALRNFKCGLPFGRDMFAEVVESACARPCKARDHSQERTLSLSGRSADTQRFAAFQNQVGPANQFLVDVTILVEIIHRTRLRERRASESLVGKVQVFYAQGFVVH